MGASGSVQVSPTIEISFVDVNTGTLLPEKEINKIIKQVEFDFKKDFYNAYKVIDNKNPYDKYKKWLERNANP
jgi:hypothetical protein